MTKYVNSSAKLYQVFDNLKAVKGLYLFESFEAICKNNYMQVNQRPEVFIIFKRFLEKLECADSLIITTINNLENIPPELLRCFDEVIHYTMPTDAEIEKLFNFKLDLFERKINITENIVKEARGLSQDEITRVCNNAIKEAILTKESIREETIITLLKERKKNLFKSH